MYSLSFRLYTQKHKKTVILHQTNELVILKFEKKSTILRSNNSGFLTFFAQKKSLLYNSISRMVLKDKIALLTKFYQVGYFTKPFLFPLDYFPFQRKSRTSRENRSKEKKMSKTWKEELLEPLNLAMLAASGYFLYKILCDIFHKPVVYVPPPKLEKDMTIKEVCVLKI